MVVVVVVVLDTMALLMEMVAIMVAVLANTLLRVVQYASFGLV
jgi:hypothetical protein